MKKTVLVILSSSKQKRYLPQDSSKYHYLSRAITDSRLPTELVENFFQEFKATKIDGVFGVNDRSSVVATLLAKKLRLPGPSKESVATAQHKALSMQIFSEITSSSIPTINFSLQTIENVKNFSFPAFYRPVKGYLSRDSGFAHSYSELVNKIITITQSERSYTKWFDDFFSIALNNYPSVDSFILQPNSSGKQLTVDGFIQNKVVTISAITESVMRNDVYSFDKFQLPMQLNPKQIQKIQTTLEKYIQKIGYDNAAFNTEFFVDGENITPIEFNTRLSLQFKPMFDYYFERDYLEILADISTGTKIEILTQKSNKYATCFILRKLSDCFVSCIPDRTKIESLVSTIPELLEVAVYCKKNRCLSDVLQDEYSYRYAGVTIVGNSKNALTQNAEKILPLIKSLFKFKC